MKTVQITFTGPKSDDLARLASMDPPVKRLAVESPDPAMALLLLLPLDQVCYITTRSDAGRAETRRKRNLAALVSNGS